MFGFSDTQKQMQDLLLEIRSFVELQKKVLLAETRDKLTYILSRLAIAVVCLVLGGMMLLFFSFFLAYIVGQAIGNIAVGFACVTLLVCLLLIIFWHWRTTWIIIPLTRLLCKVFTVNEQPIEAETAMQELQQSRTRMSDTFNSLVHGSQEPASRVETVSNWVSRGFALYEGLRIGLSVVRAFTGVFGGRKRRRRR